MEITVNLKAPELSQAIQALAAALTGQPVIAITGGSKNAKAEEALVMVGATYDALAETVKPSSGPVPQSEEVDKQPPTSKAKKVFTLEEVRALFVAKNSTTNRDKLKQILTDFNVKKVTDLQEKDFEAVVARLEAL
jgi:hypothetical protein